MNTVADTLPEDVASLLLTLHKAGVYRDGEYTGNVASLRGHLLCPTSGLYAEERILLPTATRIAETLVRAEVYGYAARKPAINAEQERNPVWCIYDLYAPTVAKGGRGPARLLPLVHGNHLTLYFASPSELHRFEGWLQGQLSERPTIKKQVGALVAHVIP